MDLTIAVVNWNGAALTLDCLEAIRRTAPPDLALEIVVVDNGSEPDDVQALRERAQAQGFQLIENPANLGYARANNQALRAARGRYVLLLNNDTQVLEGALVGLVRYMDEHPSVGIAGARLVDAEGHQQPSHDLFPLTPWRLAYERLLDTLWPANGRTRHSRIVRWGHDPQEPLEVDWVPGAALIVRRALLEQVGLLDEGYFLYGEDIDWCYRAKRAGWRVMYLPQATIVHVHGGSSRKRPALARVLQRQRDCSLVRFYRLHYGLVAAAGIGLWLILKRLLQRRQGSNHETREMPRKARLQ